MILSEADVFVIKNDMYCNRPINQYNNLLRCAGVTVPNTVYDAKGSGPRKGGVRTRMFPPTQKGWQMFSKPSVSLPNIVPTRRTPLQHVAALPPTLNSSQTSENTKLPPQRICGSIERLSYYFCM